MTVKNPRRIEHGAMPDQGTTPPFPKRLLSTQTPSTSCHSAANRHGRSGAGSAYITPPLPMTGTVSDSRHLRSLVATGLLLPPTKSVGAVVGSLVGVAVRPLAHTVEQREMFTHRTLVELVRHLCHASFNDAAVTSVTGSSGLIVSFFTPASFAQQRDAGTTTTRERRTLLCLTSANRRRSVAWAPR